MGYIVSRVAWVVVQNSSALHQVGFSTVNPLVLYFKPLVTNLESIHLLDC